MTVSYLRTIRHLDTFRQRDVKMAFPASAVALAQMPVLGDRLCNMDHFDDTEGTEAKKQTNKQTKQLSLTFFNCATSGVYKHDSVRINTVRRHCLQYVNTADSIVLF